MLLKSKNNNNLNYCQVLFLSKTFFYKSLIHQENNISNSHFAFSLALLYWKSMRWRALWFRYKPKVCFGITIDPGGQLTFKPEQQIYFKFLLLNFDF